MTIRSYSDFKFENHPSIIEASRIIIAEGSAVYRVVLRNTGAASVMDGAPEYVTHQENLILEGDTWKHGDFYWGHYFNAASDSDADNKDALGKAIADYNERCAKL